MLKKENFWWEDRSCLAATIQNKIVAPICQHDSAAATDSTADITTTTESFCPVGWEKFEDHCYFHSGISFPSCWSTAEADCRRKGGHLASVHSVDEMEFIWNLSINTSNTIWLGGQDFIINEVKILRFSTHVSQCHFPTDKHNNP